MLFACPATDDFFRSRIDHMIDLRNPLACRRQFKIDHLCQLNFDQGSKAGCLASGCG